MRLPKTDPSVATTSDTAAWWMLALMLATCLAAASGLGFRIDAWRAVPPAVGLTLLGGAAWFGRRHDRPRLAAGSIAFLQMTLFTLFGVVLAYALAARAGALWDARLAAADRALGFDWPAVFTAADRAPAALWIGAIAYHSLTLQMVTCIVAMSAYAQFDRLRVAVAAAILSGFATILISWWMPAMGNVFDPAHYTRLWPSIAWIEQAMIAGLRDGTWRVLDLTQLMGIVSFPSFHATLPVILSWAQRDTPVWRFVAPVWAGVTIIATPLFGGHYGIDVLGGLALAPLALAIAPWLVRRRGAARAGLRSRATWRNPLKPGSNMASASPIRRDTHISALLAAAIGAAWLAIHVGGIFFWSWSVATMPVAILLIVAQAWLSTGLFIVAHDCMHGSFAPGHPRANRVVGTLCLGAYAALSFRALHPKHHAHHAAPGTEHDPDFHAGAPRRALPWFVRFFSGYYTHGQIARITLATIVYLLLGASLVNIVAFWAVPALLALAQLFFFGTYLPHRHDDAPFADHHNARSSALSPLASVATCFHFGAYHHEHHLSPRTPWWRLPRVRPRLTRAPR